MKIKKKYNKGGKFKDALKGAFTDHYKNIGGPFGGVAGALEKRREMKALGAKPTFKGMAKGYLAGMLPGLAGGVADRMMGDPGDGRTRRNRAFDRGGRLRKY